MNCPKCNSSCNVVNTVNNGTWIHRTRRCVSCGHQFNTAELRADKLIAARAAIKQDSQGRILISHKLTTAIAELVQSLPAIPEQLHRPKKRYKP